MVHFNDVLGVTASNLIKYSGGNLSDHLSLGELEKCSSTGCILINCNGPLLLLYVMVRVSA